MRGQSHITRTPEEELSSLGFGTFQILALVFAGIGWLSESMEMTLLSFIGPAVKSQWSLSPTEESLLSTSVFAGMLIGALFWGFISDVYGRRMGIIGVSLVTSGAGLLSAFTPNYTSLVITRCVLGFGVAGGHVFQSWFLELIPSCNRGSWMLSMLIFWIFGEFFEASLAWIVLPRLGWRWLLALSSLPSFIVIIFCNLVPESPRFLYKEGRTDEALRVLRKIAAINRKELPEGILLCSESNPSTENPDDEENSKSPPEQTDHVPLLSSRNKMTSLETCFKTMHQLFSRDLYITTVLLLLLHFGFTFAYYGIVLMISSVSSEQNPCGLTTNVFPLLVHDTSSSLYRNVMITCSAEFPGLVIATVLLDRIGRKLSIEILAMITLILILPLTFHQNEIATVALLLGARMLLFAAFSSLTIYAKEVYPTSIRATGSGLATSVGRIGGMVCPLVAVGLVRGCHQTIAVIMFGVIILVSGICVLFFPFETKGQGLKELVNE